MQETVSGFRFQGRWEDLVNKGKQVTEALEAADADQEHVAEWEDWRPREEDDLRKDVREKTVEQACLDENTVEEAGKSAVETAGESVGDMGRAVEKATKGDTAEASAKSRDAAVSAVLSVETVVRKGVRKMEAFVYRHIVTRTNPCYFDNETVAVALKEKRQLFDDDGEEYEMAVEFRDDEVFNHCRDQLDD